MNAGRRRRSRIRPSAVVAGLVVLVVAGAAVGAVARRLGGGGAEWPSGPPPATASSGTGRASGPPATSSRAPDRGALVIHGTGDVSLDPSSIPAFATHGYGWAWSGLNGLFQHDDLTVVNLECPVTEVVAPVPKEFTFRCDPAALPAARRAGVEVVNQANNHAYDQGPEGLVDSLGQIRDAGLTPVGAGRDEDQALRAALFHLNGWTVAVLGIDEVPDPVTMVAGPDTPGTAAGLDFSPALRAIRDAAAEADIVIVAIHWGVELDTTPRAYQVEEAHRMIDAGADVIFGHHSHRLQPMATYRGRPIFFGLGNFVWPHLSQEGSTTAVAQVRVAPNGRFRGRLLPAFVVSDGHPVLR